MKSNLKTFGFVLLHGSDTLVAGVDALCLAALQHRVRACGRAELDHRARLLLTSRNRKTYNTKELKHALVT